MPMKHHGFINDVFATCSDATRYFNSADSVMACSSLSCWKSLTSWTSSIFNCQCMQGRGSWSFEACKSARQR